MLKIITNYDLNINDLRNSLRVLNNIVDLKNVCVDNNKVVRNYELKYGIESEIIIDLSNEEYEIEKIDSKMYYLLIKKFYENLYLEMKYKYKTGKGIKNIFQKAKTNIKRVYIKDLYKFLQNEVQESKLYFHKIRYLFKRYLSALRVDNEQAINIIYLMEDIDLITIEYFNIEDFKLEKLILNKFDFINDSR